MNPEIKLILGCVLVSLSLTYGWWVHFRVVCLREDLFAIRDRLFDHAATLNRFDDPAYQDARRRLNILIRFAHIWSFPVFATALVKPVDGHKRLVSEDESFDVIISEHIDGASYRYVSYMISSTLTGWVVVTMALVIMPPVALTSWLSRRVAFMLDTQSDLPEESFHRLA